MGIIFGRDEGVKDLPEIHYKVFVKNGDKKFAGSDSRAGIILHGEGQSSDKIWLDRFLKNDFERGERNEFSIKATKIDKIDAIELFRGFGVFDDWFVDTVEVKNEETGEMFIFPVYRWLKSRSSIMIAHLDTALPQYDMCKQQRQQELKSKRNQYQLEVKVPGLPPEAKKLPRDEKFSFNYIFDLGTKFLTAKIKASQVKEFIPGRKWNDLKHIKSAYPSSILPMPDTAEYWSDDKHFGRQRISSINNSVIKLCEAIPCKLPVTEEMVKPFLQGMSLQEVLDKKRLFIVDYDILKEIKTNEGKSVCAPIALFFVDNDEDLVPVAIQLYQDPSVENPIFLPSDPKYTWMMAKLWFNNSDASYHQSVTHLGLTHLLMESISLVTNRQLSPSHPIFKLLVPHFLFIHAINSLALDALVNVNGWVDQVMNIGRLGMFDLVGRAFKTWRMDVEGSIREDLRKRGVLTNEVLPGYHFREDAVRLHDIIEKYVKSYVDIYYGDDISRLSGDWEIQRWVQEMMRPVDKHGVGLKGVPCGKDGKLENKEQLVKILTVIIYTCSVGHAAANFQQYEQYGFPPNYPAYMKGKPSKDKTSLTEKDILDALPDQAVTLSIMVMTKILSEKATHSLGYFEIEYIHDPDAIAVLNQFRKELHEMSNDIENNTERKYEYKWLNPKNIPNAISI